jgi:glucosamine--fructose-6-phosphate aminotransferase (isomerizing)
MCGIVGIVSKEPIMLSDAVNSLKRLEYRGYDSFGFATNSGYIEKHIGEIEEFWAPEIAANVICCHTRWATHGGVTEANAHPHADCHGELFVVHNGIIDNFRELRSELEAQGHVFRSETDTEIIAHFFEGKDIKEAVPEFFRRAKGEFAVLIVKKGDSKIYALKKGSPLVLGLHNGQRILASDIYAFSNKTNEAVFFSENEFAVIDENGYEFFKVDGKLTPERKNTQTFEWSGGKETKRRHDHYMLKEILEEPEVSERLIRSLQTEQKSDLTRLKEMMGSSKRVLFVAAGTSYHASLLGVYFLNKAGIEAHTIIASEFRDFPLVDENTLAIAISQSGETMDVIEALKWMKAKGATIASLVNVPYSTIQRMSDISVNILAGQEICVAATKSFVNQVTLLLYLASLFGYEVDIDYIPEGIRKTLQQEREIAEIAKQLAVHKDIYAIGRGLAYPVAREIALKIKEISYIHAEGMMGGELKHGTLALIESGTPVISLMPKGDEDIISNSKEVEARQGRVLAITNNGECNMFESVSVPTADYGTFCILAAIVGQLLTYYIAKEKHLPIDKPRNLAKSVTVK